MLRWPEKTNSLKKGFWALVALPYLLEVYWWSRHFHKTNHRHSLFLHYLPSNFRNNILRGIQFWIFRFFKEKCLLSSASVFLANNSTVKPIINFGFKKSGDKLEGHCWLSDRPEDQQDFIPLFQIS